MMGEIIVPPSTHVIAGRPKWPAWRQGGVVHRWHELFPVMLDEDPNEDPEINTNFGVGDGRADWFGQNPGLGLGLDSLAETWNGGALDEIRSLLYRPGTGGHRAYWGNEVWQCDLSHDAPRWSHRNWPTGSYISPDSVLGDDGAQIQGWYDSDKQKRSDHTYDLSEVHLPTGDVFQGCGGAFAADVGGFHYWAFRYSRATESWVRLQEQPNVLGGGAMCYDKGRDLFYNMAQRSPLFSIDPATGNITQLSITNRPLYTSDPTVNFQYQVAVYDEPGDAVMVTMTVDDATLPSRIGYWHRSDNIWRALTVTGTPPVNGALAFGNHGFVYDTTRERYLAQPLDGSAKYHILTPPAGTGLTRMQGTWTWSEQAADVGNTVTPPTPAVAGTFNRWTYSERYDCILYTRKPSEPIYWMALS